MGLRPLDPKRTNDRLLIKAGLPSYLALGERIGRTGHDFLAKLGKSAVPPNHPFLPLLSEPLGVSDRVVIAAFSAKGKPLAEMHARRIAARFLGKKHSTNRPSRRQTPVSDATTIFPESRPMRGGHPMTDPIRSAARGNLNPDDPGDAILLASRYPSWNALIQAVRSAPSQDMLNKFRARAVAPNHPHLNRYAELLGIGQDQFRDVFAANGTALSSGMIERVARTGNKASAKRNGAGPATGKGKRGGYNKLKTKGPLDLRQATRTLISTANIAAMEGEDAIRVPITALYVVLQDYIERCHIKGAVLISPDFPEQFG